MGPRGPRAYGLRPRLWLLCKGYKKPQELQGPKYTPEFESYRAFPIVFTFQMTYFYPHNVQNALENCRAQQSVESQFYKGSP